MSGAIPVEVLAAGANLATSSSSQAYQRSAQDKVVYLHDGSLLVGHFDGSKGVIYQVTNPSTAPVATQVQTISGDEVTLYTQPGPNSTDIWIQVGAELVGSAPLEQIQHGVYNGSTFAWDTVTTIPGTIAPGRQDPSVTWTGKWLIASWWDDTNFSNSDNVFVNWTTDKTGKTGWQPSATWLTTTGHTIVQVSIRHSARLGATILVYTARSRLFTRTLLDSKADPSLGNWTAESKVDPAYDDSGAGFGGPQVAIDENSGKIHVFRAVTNSGGPSWTGVTYWLGVPDAVPMVTGVVNWNPRLVIDPTASSTGPPDIAGAVDAAGKVYVFWATSVTAGAIKYVTLVSPYTSASPATTLATSGTQPRYPHIPAQAPLSRGYVPVVYQSGSSSPYRIVLDTTVSTSGGGDTSPPTIPAGLAATPSSTAPQVNLTWNASTDNVGVAGYTVYRNGSALGSAVGTAYTDNTVSSLSTYSYKVDAYDAAGNHSAGSAPVSVTTPDTSPPTVPIGVSAAAVSPGEIDLSWSASTDNVAVTGFTVYRNGAFLATAGGGATTWADTTVAGSTTYSYSVDAFDAAGNHSARSTLASATTPAATDAQPPTVPAGVAAQAGPVGEVDVTWSATTDNVGVTGYTVYRGGVLLATVSGSTLAYADKTAAGLTSYSYTVDAFDAAGNHSAQSVAGTVTTPDWTSPTVPAGLTATVMSADEIDLAWSASTDNIGVSGYTVYRNGAAIATTPAGTLSYASTGLSHGPTYTYTVDAYDAAGNHSAKSAPVSAHTPDDVAPTMPGGFAASAASPTAVSVSWTSSTDNVGVTGYEVNRDGVVVTTLAPTVLSYRDTVAAGSKHSYTVDAFDAAGNRSASPPVISVTTPTAPPAAPKFVQGGVVTTGSRLTTVTLTLGPVARGDLLVGWFGQYDSTGQVSVSDSVNGAWTRSASTTWHGGTAPGDIALYYFANSAAAATSLTVTITSPNPTYLQASAAEYSGVAAVSPLDQVIVAKGSGTTADSGLTAAVSAGELVYGGMTATNGAGTLTPGASQGVSFVKRTQSSSGTQGQEDIVSGAAGQQHAVLTFPTSVPWFMVCAVFKPA
jgi:chitodextrinase